MFIYPFNYCVIGPFNWIILVAYFLPIDISNICHQILTNGKYKSVVHRATVMNKKAARISVGTAHGPTLDTVVSPAPELVSQDNPSAYGGITYKDYLLLQQSRELERKSCLDFIRI
jgi:isopenicillin N synthase-like dioxygenase